MTDGRAARARSLLASGDKDGALALAQAWIRDAPELAEAHNTLGVVLIARHERQSAALAFGRAVELDPRLAKAFSNLGSVRRELGELAGAEEALRHAVQLDPSNPRAWSNLGNTLRLRGRTEAAIEAYERSVSIEPTALALYNLGTLLVEQGRGSEAVERLSSGVELDPGGPHAGTLRVTLAEALLSLGRRDEAIDAMTPLADHSSQADRVRHARSVLALAGPKRALEVLAGVEPDAATAGDYWTLRARVAERLGDLDTAEAAYETAASAIGTGFAWCEVARVRVRKVDLPGAAEALARASEVDPGSALPWLMHGQIALSQSDVATGERAFTEALSRSPDMVEATANLGRVAGMRGDSHRSLELHRKALARNPSHAAVRSNFLMSMQYAGLPRASVLAEHIANSRVGPIGVPARFEPRPLTDGRRLRVGYLSADLRNHVVARFFEDLLEAHDRSRVDLFIYDVTDKRDDVTERLRARGDAWREVHVPEDPTLAELIRADGVDVLVDLNGFTASSRVGVLALRPAPVQMSFLGYPDTTGMPEVDVRITDALADPPGLADRFVTEALVRLPRCAWSFRPDGDAPDVAARSASSPVVFAAFSNVAKISDSARRTFAEVLRRVPDSRLILKGRTYGDPKTREAFLAAFDAAGVADRVELRAWVSSGVEHLAAYNEVDIALDSFPYAGTTTTCEALWMGVPVVTLAGDRHTGRVGVSLLHAVGLDDLVADDTAGYVECVVKLAADRPRLAHLRSTLRDRISASPLRDGASYASALEDVYASRYEAYCRFAERTTGPDVWLGLSDGAVVSVPDRVDCATRFILEEQGDWFEPERNFVRALLDEGDVALDVGANFGVYSLSMAKRVGPLGRVLSFEPAPLTAAHLRRSADRAPAIRVVEAAVGAERGESLFDLGASPELAELVAATEAAGRSREMTKVEVVPLDDYLDELRGVLFAKVDAEGAEHLVLEGAKQLLAREDPIWLLELRHGSSVNHQLLAALAERAPHLQLMRWVDPLGALVPFDPKGALDAKWLNLIAISSARRRQLVERNLAVRDDVKVRESSGGDPERHARAARSRAQSAGDVTARREHSLEALSAARRAFHEQHSAARAFLLARVAHEAGVDGEAFGVIDAVTSQLAAGARLVVPDDALPPLPVQDASMKTIDPTVAVEALALEARMELGSWSSYYALASHEQSLERIATLGALTRRLTRRRDTIRRFRARLAGQR